MAWEVAVLLETNVNRNLRNYCGFERTDDNSMVRLRRGASLLRDLHQMYLEMKRHAYR